MYSPLISVIVPVYNSKDYLSRCIESILGQSYRPLEIILIDDGSVDGSDKICDKYAAGYSFIRTYHIPNGGASQARKKGLSLSAGQYVTFVDSDDWIEYDYVERLAVALQRQKVQIAACDVMKHTEDESFGIARKEGVLLLGEEELHRRFFHYEFWGFYGKIYEKSVFSDIYFPDATINEDYVVMAQLFYKCKCMAYVNIPLYHYITHKESLSNQKLSNRMMDEWTNKLWCYHFYQDHFSEWVKQAEAQTAETCCKLIAAIGDVDEFQDRKREMQLFLRKHYLSLLLCNKHFVWGLKIISLWRIIY